MDLKPFVNYVAYMFPEFLVAIFSGTFCCYCDKTSDTVRERRKGLFWFTVPLHRKCRAAQAIGN